MSAVYLGGQIFVPVRPGHTRTQEALRRTLRHEYVHAVTDTLSGRRAPVWLDEGLAQLFEGKQASAAHLELCSRAIPSLESLEGSFATFTRDEAHAAYALSLFATRSLVDRFGLTAVRTFLEDLRQHPNDTPQDCFLRAFGKQSADFETEIQLQLLKLPCANS